MTRRLAARRSRKDRRLWRAPCAPEPRTVVMRIVDSARPGFLVAAKPAPVLRPLMPRVAERRYALRAG
jgi:hypothetical protein